MLNEFWIGLRQEMRWARLLVKVEARLKRFENGFQKASTIKSQEVKDIVAEVNESCEKKAQPTAGKSSTAS